MRSRRPRAGRPDRRRGYGRKLALDALEQAIWERQEESTEGLIHRSDKSIQHPSIRYTKRLAEAGNEPWVGSIGGSYDNALAEPVIGLQETEVIRNRRPLRGLDDVELAALE